MAERIQKILSQLGVASRRQAEELILNHRVLVNGQAAQLGDRIDIHQDVLTINNRQLVINKTQQFVYYVLNKPRGYVCSTRDVHAPKLVTALLPQQPKVWPVGRLDKDSSGLIVLTNDGELTNQLTHPKFKHEKEYEVTVSKHLTQLFLKRMRQGIRLSEGLAQADKIKFLTNQKFSLVLHQGWHQQIRRMCEKLGYRVVELKRVRFGNIKLGNLKEGKYIKIQRSKIKT